MDSFILGEAIENYKLPVPVIGIVKNETPSVKHIGNLLIRRVLVQVGEDTLEWMLENVRRPVVVLPSVPCPTVPVAAMQTQAPAMPELAPLAV